MIDLISERAGGRILTFNDEFFAEASNLLKSSEPVANDEYTDRGKWMDGWETRRRREPGHDWCVIALGIPGRIQLVTVDTSHFTGNYPEQCSLDASGGEDPARADWVEVIPRSDLSGDAVAVFDVSNTHRVEMVRLNIYPDGGVARLRVEGIPIPARQLVCPGRETDLASASVGGVVVGASDLHYSHPANMLRPTASAGMWDGWETRRRRDDGADWVVVKLGIPGEVGSVVVDTSHFKGNAPGWVSGEVSGDGVSWHQAFSRVAVGANRVNSVPLDKPARASFLRLTIHPDGGVARLAVMGRPDREAAGVKCLLYLNSLLDRPAREFLEAACSSKRWIEAMISGRPFGTLEAMLDAAESVFDDLSDADWLEAFSGHPRIGERGDEVSDREQSGVSSASRATLRDLADVNREYEDRFGFTYIVYATGKTADEMLAMARSRLASSREQEISTAAGEQRRISMTRLRRMMCQEET
jgi:allantoicase